MLPAGRASDGLIFQHGDDLPHKCRMRLSTGIRVRMLLESTSAISP